MKDITIDREIVDLLLAKKFNLPFERIQVNGSGGNTIIEGRGSLKQEEIGDVEIEIEGELSHSTELLMLGMPKKSGSYTRVDELGTADGQTATIEMAANGVNYRRVGESPHIFEAKLLTLRKKVSRDKNMRLLRLTEFEPLMRTTTVLDQNLMTDHANQLPLTWATLDVSGTIFSLSGHDTGQFLRCEQRGVTTPKHLRLEDAAVTALSFVASKYIHVISVCELSSQASLEFRTHFDSTDMYVSPIKWVHEDTVAELIQLIATLIYVDESNELRTIIRHYLTEPGPLFTHIRCLHICILIEALLDTLPILHSWPKVDRSAIKKDVVRACEILKASHGEFTLENFNLIKSKIKELHRETLHEKYTYAMQQLHLPEVEKEWIMFREFRNNLAHGTIHDPYNQTEDEAQTYLDAVWTVTNIFNKLILASAGYRGPYFDYVKQDIQNLTSA
ncbi:MAG: hypothetical protein ACHQNE_02980 [Candidatus Kapaibacterium sp.]